MDQGFRVKLVYWESGMCFCGLFDENGDDYYDYTDMSADEIAETINSEIDECMNITESIREWEEDNQEEEDE
jgi:predicted transcriptional regulator